MNVTIQKLFNLAKNNLNKSYSPYSNFRVSAAILGSNDKIYGGINIENASYPCSICAEGAAISHLITDGCKNIIEILVMAEYKDDDPPCSPCGLCRQRIREFSTENTLIHLCNTNKLIKSITLSELLPLSFGPSHLSLK